MKPIALKLSVGNRANRWFAYLCVSVVGGAAGGAVAYGFYQGQSAVTGGEWLRIVAIGILTGAGFLVAEMVRFGKYCSGIPGVLCVDCRHEFDIKSLVKTGRCPHCRSKRVVGLRSDEEDTIVDLSSASPL